MLPKSYLIEGYATKLRFGGPITKDLLEKLKEIASYSTKVVAWYPHWYDGTVRGPFGRWFTLTGGDNGMGDPVKYPTPVADIGDDVAFAAAAMNSFVPLMNEVERLNGQIEAIKNVKMPPEVFRQVAEILERRDG